MSALRDTLQAFADQGTSVAWLLYLLVLVLAVCGAYLGGFLGTYLHARRSRSTTGTESGEIEKRLDDVIRTLQGLERHVAEASPLGLRRWELKRQAYSDLLEALHQLRWHVKDLRQSLPTEDTIAPGHPPLKRMLGEELERLAQRLSVSGVFLSTGSMEIVENLINKYHSVSAQEWHRYIHLLDEATDGAYAELCELARRELSGRS